MLDYQINESISRAYSESVCGCRHKKSKSRAKNSINEDNNTVYRVQGPSQRDLISMREREMEERERERRSKLSQEELEREDRMHERMFKEAQRELERQQMDVENKKHRTYMVAAPERKERPKAILTSQGEAKRAQMRAREYADPGMRLGNSVYQGLELALPVAAFGKFNKGANVAKELAALGNVEKGAMTAKELALLNARIAALEQGAARGGGGMMKWMLSPKGNIASAALGTTGNYVSDELRKRGHDLAADIADEAKMLAFLPGPIGYSASNIAYKRLNKDGSGDSTAKSNADNTQSNDDNTQGHKWCNANGNGTGCGFIAANQTELDKHYETCPLLK